MNNDTKQIYGLTESQYCGLYQAEHLTKVLMTLAERTTDETQFLNQIQSESFCVVMALIGDLINTAAIKGIQNHRA